MGRGLEQGGCNMATYHRLPLGSDLPDFWLPDFEGIIIPKDHLLGAPAILIIFMANQCPFVQHVRELLVKFIWEYQQRGVIAVGINANDIESVPEDRPDRMKEDARIYGYTFPYLFDGTQEVAKLFRVHCTPDFFVFNRGGKLAYHGQFDDSRPGNDKPVTGKDLRRALNHVLLGQNPPVVQKPVDGSPVRWRAGNEPEYFIPTPRYQVLDLVDSAPIGGIVAENLNTIDKKSA